MEGRLAAAVALAAVSLTCASTASAQTAPGAPGALSHFDLARKDCVGTAQDRVDRLRHRVGGSAQLDYTLGPVAIGPVQP